MRDSARGKLKLNLLRQAVQVLDLGTFQTVLRTMVVEQEAPLLAFLPSNLQHTSPTFPKLES